VTAGAAAEALRVPVNSHATQVMAMSYLMLAASTYPAAWTWKALNFRHIRDEVYDEMVT
jgi:hypothetical protein